jgi:hypothetical protein
MIGLAFPSHGQHHCMDGLAWMGWRGAVRGVELAVLSSGCQMFLEPFEYGLEHALVAFCVESVGGAFDDQ